MYDRKSSEGSIRPVVVESAKHVVRIYIYSKLWITNSSDFYIVTFHIYSRQIEQTDGAARGIPNS